jgi:hypothetical protein
MKTCCVCKNDKPFSAFHKDSYASDGYQSRCAECKAQYNLICNKKHNPLQCFVAGKYVSVKHPLHVAGMTFPTWDAVYLYWRQLAGDNLAYEPVETTASKAGFVYVIYNPVWDDWYKIGKTDDLEKRLRSYQTGDPHRAYKICYEMSFDDCHKAEQQILSVMQDDDKILKKKEWVSTTIDRIRNVIHEVKRNERASSGHRNGQQSELDLVLCN